MPNYIYALISSLFAAWINLFLYQDPLSSVVAAILAFVTVYLFCRFVDFLSKKYFKDNDPSRS